MRYTRFLAALALVTLSGPVLAASCDGFVDVDGSNTTYCPAVSYVKDRGVTVGCTDSTHYCPNDFVSRLQMALFLQRMGRADPSNTLGDHTTTVGGGTHNRANSSAGFDTVAGGSDNESLGGYSSVGGGITNLATNTASTVAGGSNNEASGIASAVPGGFTNKATGDYSVVGGGTMNTASIEYSAIGGGTSNVASNGYSTVAEGFGNTASGNGSAVAGGSSNTASGDHSVVLGGYTSTASGNFSVALGGYTNTASGYDSVAIGANANANATQCVVVNLWSVTGAMDCGGSTNVFRIGADLGLAIDYNSQEASGFGTRYVGIGKLAAGQTITTWTGAFLSDAGVWTNVSDRNAKQDFTPLDNADILDRVVRMSVERWSYKAEPQATHIGPVAQDFYAAFNVGSDDKHITPIDEGGVALAAIQGLNAKLGQQLQERDAEIAALKARLDRLEVQSH